MRFQPHLDARTSSFRGALDTSAPVKTVIAESESKALASWLGDMPP